jgi:hypothetical protein
VDDIGRQFEHRRMADRHETVQQGVKMQRRSTLCQDQA